MTPDEAITIVTTTSPISSHPSTWIVDEVYKSARKHLPNARYLFLCDGVREEQEYLRTNYEQYIVTIAGRANRFEWPNTECIIFPTYHHQAGMVRAALARNIIKTPLVLWLEHDFPFNGLPIDWPRITDSLLAAEICYLRFALPEETHASIQALHSLLASRFGVPMMQHKNYSSLPHVCRIDFLKRLAMFFKRGQIHLECEATEGIAYHEEEWRLALYTPPGELARVYSLDGRAGPAKLPMVL